MTSSATATIGSDINKSTLTQLTATTTSTASHGDGAAAADGVITSWNKPLSDIDDALLKVMLTLTLRKR
jgi:hypothetical protein